MLITSRKIRYLVFLTGVWMFTDAHTPLLALSQICSDICTSSSDCSTPCYLTQEDLENGAQSSCLDYGVYDTSAYCCGDNVCNTSTGVDESSDNCPYDCGPAIPTEPVCPDGQCEEGESCTTCPEDCGSCGSSSSCDGDGQCETGEGKDCSDCQTTGYCHHDSDCPDNPGNGYEYNCQNDTCVLVDLPDWTLGCVFESDICPPGESCQVSDQYDASCGSVCFVCLPNWAQ